MHASRLILTARIMISRRARSSWKKLGASLPISVCGLTTIEIRILLPHLLPYFALSLMSEAGFSRRTDSLMLRLLYMRLAVIAGVDKRVSLESKGGSEVWAAQFVTEAAKRGHTVDLYAVGGSLEVPGSRVVPILPQTLPTYLDNAYFSSNTSQRKEQLMSTVYGAALNQIAARAGAYDLLIDSVAYPSFSFNTGTLSIPALMVGHFPVDFMLEFYQQIFGWPERTTVVFPSKYQYEHAKFLEERHKVHIPHGIDERALRFSPKGSNTMVWMSRVHHTRMDKGLEDAVLAAHSTGRTLRASGIVERSSRAYFEERIQPHLYGTVSFVEQSPDAAPELIDDGVTGLLVNPSDADVRGDFIIKKAGFEGLCEAIQWVYGLDEASYLRMRANSREKVAESYSIGVMIDGYEKLFARM